MKHLLILLVFATLFIGCKEVTTTVVEKNPTTTVVVEQPTVLEPIKVEAYSLSWELPTNDGQVYQSAKPERKAWTAHLVSELDKSYDVLMTAKDIRTIIPKFDSLTREQRIWVLAELISTVTEYESSWNPTLQAKDTNGRSEAKYRATGLCQMNSAEDQTNYKTGTKYTYTQLQDPLINLEVCVKIMVTVVKIRGKITFSKYEKSPVLRFFFATLVTDTAYGSKTLKAAHGRINKLVEQF